MEKKDNYNPKEISDIAKAFAHAAIANYKLNQMKDFDSKRSAASEVLERIKEYREVTPINIQERLSDFRELEQYCNSFLGI